MIRPTRKAVLVVFLLFGLSVVTYAITGHYPVLAVVLMMLSILILSFDYLIAFPYRLLNIEYQIPEEVHIGVEGYIKITSKPVYWRFDTKIYLQVHTGSLIHTPEVFIAEIVSGQGISIKIPLRSIRRGTTEISHLSIYWYGLGELMEIKKVYDISKVITISPNVNVVGEAILKYFSKDAFWGFKLQNLIGDGSEFTALRDYVPGMDTRSLDWKHSAKHRKMISKEYEVERNHNVIFVFDTGYLMSEVFDGISYLDHSINAALLLAYVALKKGDKIGVFAFDQEIRNKLLPLRGTHSFKAIQQNLSEIDYHDCETNFTLGLSKLSAWLNRRSLVVLFTDFVDTVTAEIMIQNVGYLVSKHLIIFVTFKNIELLNKLDKKPENITTILEAVVADEFLKDRQVVLTKLKQQGIHCLEVKSKNLSIELLNKYISIKRLELI